MDALPARLAQAPQNARTEIRKELRFGRSRLRFLPSSIGPRSDRLVLMSQRDRMSCRTRDAIHVIGIATFNFDLNRRMRNAEMCFEFTVDTTQNVLPAANALLADCDMTTARDDSRADGPDVQIVHR